MNLRNFTWDHVKGILLGIVTPLICVPLVLLIISWVQNYYFDFLWNKFSLSEAYRIKILTISIIANLIWFYLFLNKERWNLAMGVILGSIAFAPYVLYIKFF